MEKDLRKWNFDTDIHTIRIIFGNSPVKFVNKSDARYTVSFHLSVNRQSLTLEFRKKNDIQYCCNYSSCSCSILYLTLVSIYRYKIKCKTYVYERRGIIRYEKLVEEWRKVMSFPGMHHAVSPNRKCCLTLAPCLNIIHVQGDWQRRLS